MSNPKAKETIGIMYGNKTFKMTPEELKNFVKERRKVLDDEESENLCYGCCYFDEYTESCGYSSKVKILDSGKIFVLCKKADRIMEVAINKRLLDKFKV
jgi:hypothetical protein